MCEIAQSKVTCACCELLKDLITDRQRHGLPRQPLTQESVTPSAAVDSARL